MLCADPLNPSSSRPARPTRPPTRSLFEAEAGVVVYDVLQHSLGVPGGRHRCELKPHLTHVLQYA